MPPSECLPPLCNEISLHFCLFFVFVFVFKQLKGFHCKVTVQNCQPQVARQPNKETDTEHPSVVSKKTKIEKVLTSVRIVNPKRTASWFYPDFILLVNKLIHPLRGTASILPSSNSTLADLWCTLPFWCIPWVPYLLTLNDATAIFTSMNDWKSLCIQQKCNYLSLEFCMKRGGLVQKFDFQWVLVDLFKPTTHTMSEGMIPRVSSSWPFKDEGQNWDETHLESGDCIGQNKIYSKSMSCLLFMLGLRTFKT